MRLRVSGYLFLVILGFIAGCQGDEKVSAKKSKHPRHSRSHPLHPLHRTTITVELLTNVPEDCKRQRRLINGLLR